MSELLKGPEMPKAQQRRVERLTDEVDLILEADRRFFARRPDRHHRVRVAARAELELIRTVGGRCHQPPAGCSDYAAVKQLAPGVRTRVFLYGTAGASTDLPEEVARAIFDNTFHNTGNVLDEEGRPR